ncbi:hypothetical protein [Flagellimonas meridianipacifica]|uniref:Surface antigen-like variable number repeat protein n=1 Tax=Flagellimonas meridianipacifica TaxID=1080225 RepID=A0A2T0M8M2_9FLAO|nr:hypothetical protein [Allomuricauda pacifica]PRX53825.1 hypothetical protein CLV81_2213 [Allomuricauda pacifica]
MKTIPTTLFLLCFCLSQINAQITLKLSGTENVKTFGFKEDLKIPIKIDLVGNYLPSKEDNIKVKVLTNMEILNEFLVKQEYDLDRSSVLDTLVFKDEKYPLVKLKGIVDTLIKSERLIKVAIRKTSRDKFEVEGKEVKIELADDEMIVKIENKEKTKDYDYNFFIGANFDLQNQLSTESYYAEIDVFLKELIPLKRKNNFLGVRAGLYKNNSVGRLLENSFSRDVFQVLDSLTVGDTLTLQQRNVRQTPRVSSSNLGFYGELLFNMYKNEKKNFQAFLAFHAELIERTITTEFEEGNFLDLGQFQITQDSLRLDRALQARILSNGPRTEKFYSSFFGLGTPLLYSSKSIEIFINPVFGFGDTGDRFSRDGTFKSFFLAQFHLLEQKHGIKLSGEIRKYFNANQNPFVVINLSKRFNITSLLDSNKSEDKND